MIQTEEKIKGRGVLRVQATLYPLLGNPETPEAWHKALLLPADYVVERVERNQHIWGEVFELFVLHERIPVVEDGAKLPEVEPYYIRRSNEKTGEDMGPELVRIEIHPER